MTPSFYLGLKALSDVTNLISNNNHEENSISGTYTYKGLRMGYIDIHTPQKEYALYSNFLGLRSEINLSGKRKEILKKSLHDFFRNELDKVSAIDISYEINKDEVIFSLLSQVPYKREVNNSEFIIEPLIDIMYAVNVKISYFISEFKKNN